MKKVILTVSFLLLSFSSSFKSEASVKSKCLKTLGILSLCSSLASCASTDLTTKTAREAEKPSFKMIKENLAGVMRESKRPKYQWLMQIDFNPNDFGLSPPSNPILALRGSDEYDHFKAKKFPHRAILKGQTMKIPKRMAPLNFKIPDGSKRSLGYLEFRHNGAKKAVESFSYLFEDPQKVLEKTLLIVTGGSHGASEVNDFANRLRKRYGKEIDIAIVADAIAQPGPFPSTSLSKLKDTESVGLNFYQRKDLLAGSTIHDFFNIKVEDSNHVMLSKLAEDIGLKLSTQLESDPRFFEKFPSTAPNRKLAFGMGRQNNWKQYKNNWKQFDNDRKQFERVSAPSWLPAVIVGGAGLGLFAIIILKD